MNGISHKQAMQLIHRRLDGLLNESQHSSLNEHLDSCASCRAYSIHMDGLSAHLQKQFHRRWDQQPGPSQKVMGHVMAKARRIPITNRISSGAKLLAGAMAMIVLAVAINFVVSRLQSTSLVANATETVDNASRAEDRLLAFASDQNGNLDIYTMHADGSGLTNITNHPGYDSNPFWSPDGKHIAFERDQDGFGQIYLMDADGSNLVQLTNDEAHHYLPQNIDGISNPWSSDGSKLLFLQQEPDAETSTLYSIDIYGGNTVTFASGNIFHNGLSWSPNGNYVGYVRNESPTPDATFEPGIYVADSTGSNVITVGELVPEHESLHSQYYWSKSGSSLIFTARRHLNKGKDRFIAYEASLVNAQLIERATSSEYMEDWWEGTSFVRGPGPLTLTWLHADGTFNTLKPLEICQSTGDSQHGFVAKRSPNGNQIINVICPNNEMRFYYVNSDATIIKPLLDSPISSFAVDNSMTNMTWSPDDQFIAITLVSPKKSSLYILNVQENLKSEEIVLSDSELYTAPSWQPVSNAEIVEENPIPEPTPSPLAFSLTVQEAEELAGFDVLVPTYLPEGFTFEGADYNSQSHVVTLQYTSLLGDSLNTGTINIHQKRGDFPDFSKQLGLPSQSHATPVPIGNMTGEFTRGAWVYDSPDTTIPRWEESADYYSLSWQNDGMSFIVDFLGDHVSPPISLDELVAIAESLKSKPTAQQFPSIGTNKSNGEWIAFIGGEAVPDPIPVNQDVYMIHPDGTGLVNLTQSPAYYYYLQWSPDGQHLIFIRNTTDNKTDIMMHHVGETSPEVLASTVFFPIEYNPNQYFEYSWSPDSKQIAFLDKPAGNYDIYTIDADGSNEPELRQLTNDPGQEIDFAWSPDGSQIAYQRTNGDQLSIMLMNADGSNQHEVARGTGEVRLSWSRDGKSLYAASIYLWERVKNSRLECEACVDASAIYQIDLARPSVRQIYSEHDTSKIGGWYLYDTPQNALYFMRVNPPVFVEFWGTWFRADGNSVTEIGEMDPQQTCKTTTVLNEYISPNPRFSAISNFCAARFDLYLADREATTSEKRFIHLLQLPLAATGQGGDFATLPVGWSPDGRWLVYDDGNQSVYLLDIEQILRDPTTEPVILFQSDSNSFMLSELAWQPKP